jgi:hypothetical protein
MTTNQNIILTGNTSQSVLLGTSTAFIVQNTSDKILRFKVKDSTVANGGVFEAFEKIEFNYDIDVWVDSKNNKSIVSLYVVRD